MNLYEVADAENFKLELCHVEAGLTETSQEFQLSTKMTQLAMHHHRLMKTTISGIPMKEEQRLYEKSNFQYW